MKKNKILLAFAFLFLITYLILILFVNINGFYLKNIWFALVCFFIGTYSICYFIMFKMDSSLYYGSLLINISAVSLIRFIYNLPFKFIYPGYIACFSFASFAVFVFFRQKIHFKLFAFLFVEAILLIGYKIRYLNLFALLYINGLYLLYILVNAILRIKQNLRRVK